MYFLYVFHVDGVLKGQGGWWMVDSEWWVAGDLVFLSD
jgi:hypothetical protein